MKRFFSPITSLLLAALFFLLLPAVSRAERELPADPEAILRLVRYSQALNNHVLPGELRRGSRKIPFNLEFRENQIRFHFTNPEQIIILELGDDHSMREVLDGVNRPLHPNAYAHFIRQTDINYEDLSLRFLYWPNPKLIGSERVKTRDCYQVQVTTPVQGGAYGTVIIWADKKSGGLMKMEGYNRDGKLTKRFSVVSGQKIDDVWTVQKMKIETYNPDTKKMHGRTYLELSKPKKN